MLFRQGSHNSFDLLRLVAAFAVALDHQFAFAGQPEILLGVGEISLSNTGLFVFFALSGYLIWRSLDRDPRPRRFFEARLRRIYPGAVTNAVLCVLFGAAITSLGQKAYWSDWGTWSYLLHGVAILVPPTRLVLPGVLNDARWADVNTPIWTLKYELLCYAAAFTLHRLITPRLGARPILAIVASMLSAGTAWHLAAVSLPDASDFYARYNGFNLLRFGAVFSFGALLAAAEGKGGAPWHAAARGIPAALAVLAPNPALNHVGLVLLVAFIAVDFGRTPVLFSPLYRNFGDLSYGFYLYAYPVGSICITRLYHGENFWFVALVSFALALLLSAASWRWIESPSLKLGRVDEGDFK